MSLKRRVKKLENLIEPNNGNFHIICGAEDVLDSLEEEFRKKNPDFNGLMIKVINYFKPKNAGIS